MSILRTAAAAAVLLLTVVACSSGSGSGNGSNGSIFNGNQFGCSPGTQVQLARPGQGQTGTGSINTIEIVANGSNNALFQSYQSYSLQTQDNFGNFIQGGVLTLASDPNGPHPYPSDFYYSSSFPNLQTGLNYTVYLAQTGCQPFAIGSFSS